jgi:Peptidase family M20/M25/M40/Peptidase dimerisation domain
LDTAPFGDVAAWTHPPTSGEISDGWLHGRGSSDSKAAAAIFAHVAARLRGMAGGFGGSVVLLFDVDEHTGGFGGAKAYFEGIGGPGPVDGVMIGYPGLDHLVTGGRGVLRARIDVHAIAGHSGSSHTGPGAIDKAAHLLQDLHHAPLPGPAGPEFPLPAKLTVTAVSGGEGYSMVPDLCTINVEAFHPDSTLAGLLHKRSLWDMRSLVFIPPGTEQETFSASRLFAAVYPEAIDIAAILSSPTWRKLAAGDDDQLSRFTQQIGPRIGVDGYQPRDNRDPIAHWIEQDCWRAPS